MGISQNGYPNLLAAVSSVIVSYLTVTCMVATRAMGYGCNASTVAETRLKDLVYDSIAVELVDLALQLLSLASQFVSR